MARILHQKCGGKIISNGVKLSLCEMDTVLFFVRLGKEIELIPSSHTPKDKRADFIMDGLEWEAKRPVKCQRRSLERIFYRASTQSQNLVFDLRDVDCDVTALRVLEKCFENTRRVRRMYVIMCGRTLNYYNKR